MSETASKQPSSWIYHRWKSPWSSWKLQEPQNEQTTQTKPSPQNQTKAKLRPNKKSLSPTQTPHPQPPPPPKPSASQRLRWVHPVVTPSARAFPKPSSTAARPTQFLGTLGAVSGVASVSVVCWLCRVMLGCVGFGFVLWFLVGFCKVLFHDTWCRWVILVFGVWVVW